MVLSWSHNIRWLARPIFLGEEEIHSDVELKKSFLVDEYNSLCLVQVPC